MFKVSSKNFRFENISWIGWYETVVTGFSGREKGGGTLTQHLTHRSVQWTSFEVESGTLNFVNKVNNLISGPKPNFVWFCPQTAIEF